MDLNVMQLHLVKTNEQAGVLSISMGTEYTFFIINLLSLLAPPQQTCNSLGQIQLHPDSACSNYITTYYY